MQEILFASGGAPCAAWHLPARSRVMTTPAGRPCVVMGNGFGGTRDSGMVAFAGPFAAAGCDVLIFDYRGFGASGGTPRQDISFRRQRRDYHAAIAAARALPGIDPERIVLWGTSYSAGHVVAVAAKDRRIAAVISTNPALDGLVALKSIAAYAGPLALVKATGHGLKDASRALRGRPGHHVPIVGPPGSSALMSAPGAEEAYLALVGPTWRNEVLARTALEAAQNRPALKAGRVVCPWLVQVGTQDTIAPPEVQRRARREGPARRGARLPTGPLWLLRGRGLPPGGRRPGGVPAPSLRGTGPHRPIHQPAPDIEEISHLRLRHRRSRIGRLRTRQPPLGGPHGQGRPHRGRRR